MMNSLLLRRSLISIRPKLSFIQQSVCLFSSTSNNTHRKRLDVAIVGAPNAGKSQLLNVLTKSNVAAVSRKRHTTRDGILGGRTQDYTQILFVDTPGFLRKDARQDEGLSSKRDDLQINSALQEIQDVDYTLIVVDAAKNLTNPAKETLVDLMLKALHAGGRLEGDGITRNGLPANAEKFALVLNKVDLVKPKQRLLEISHEMINITEECIKYSVNAMENDSDDSTTQPKDVDPELMAELFPTMFYVSALHDDGVDDIWNHLMQKATPCQEWILSEGEVTQMTPIERVEECIREKCYRCLHREVPHHIHQVNRTFQMLNNDDHSKVLRVDQDLVVRTKSHHRLVMGQGGKTLRRIQQSAKQDLERMFDCPVMLHLQVTLSKSKRPPKTVSFAQGTRIDLR